MNNNTNQLRSADYDHLLTLAGELGSLPNDALIRRKHAMASLRSLLPSKSAMFIQTRTVKGRYRMIAPVLVGMEDAPRDLLPAYFSGKLPIDPCAAVMERAIPSGAHARMRRTLVNDRAWYGSTFFDAVVRPLRIDDGVYARAVSRRGNVFGMALFREPGDRPMEERHRQLLWAFCHRLAPLCMLDDADEPVVEDLQPRYRAVARRFLAGDSSKEAARHLGLSIHTIREYSKHLHRQFNVSTRTELVSRLLDR